MIGGGQLVRFSLAEIKHRFPEQLLFGFAGKAKRSNANENPDLLETQFDPREKMVQTSERAILFAFGSNRFSDLCLQTFQVNKPNVNCGPFDRSKMLAVIDTRRFY